MLLAIDVGNTQTVLGLFQKDRLHAHWRMSTDASRSADEWTAALASFLSIKEVDRAGVQDAVICSVVPPLTGTIVEVIRAFFGKQPLEVGPGTKTGIRILYDNPLEVGSDRIANSVAALDRTGGPAIVIDFGTATTFDALSDRSEYLGGVIVPGLGISAGALFARAAKLPHVEVRKPPRIIGRNTIHSIQSGLYHGYGAMIRGMLEAIKKEMDNDPKVIATGGLSEVLSDHLAGVDVVDPHLTLEGLRIIHSKNRPA